MFHVMMWILIFGMPLALWVVALIAGLRLWSVNRVLGGGLISFCAAMVVAFVVDQFTSLYLLERYFIDNPSTLPEIALRVLWIILMVAAFWVDARRKSRIVTGFGLILAAIWALMMWDFSNVRWI